MLTLISGGSRSGKSRLAVELAQKSDKEVVFCATAESLDLEMEERIALHKRNRPAEWEVVEEPLKVAKVLCELQTDQIMLFDCLTLYLSNLMGQNLTDEQILEEVETLLVIIRECAMDVIIVTNEVGQGIIPANKLARRFRDLAGQINQKVALEADHVYICFLGYPIQLK